jgi:putative membrane protein
MNRLVHCAVAAAIATTIACGDRNDSSSKPIEDPANRAGDSIGTAGAPSAGDSVTTRDPHAFVTEMAHKGNAEIQLGRLAETHASNAQVKEFGQMMVRDHSKAAEELRAVASAMHVELPSDLDAQHRSAVDELSALRGADFDRNYMNKMVADHQETLRLLELQTRTGAPLTGSPTGGTGTSTGQSGTSAETSRPSSGSPASPMEGQSAAPGGQPTANPSGSTADGEPSAANQWALKTAPTVRQHLQRALTIQQQLGGLPAAPAATTPTPTQR